MDSDMGKTCRICKLRECRGRPVAVSINYRLKFSVISDKLQAGGFGFGLVFLTCTDTLPIDKDAHPRLNCKVPS